MTERKDHVPLDGMTKEEALQEFLTSLKAAIHNSSIYFQKHPIFIKSAQEFMGTIDVLHQFLNPIKVGFSPSALFIEDTVLGKNRFYEELAAFFHFRKIKSIEIHEGLSQEELIRFLTQISLPVKTIFKDGGLAEILKKEEVSHISVEDLDYSLLLGAEGETDKDIWGYMLRDIAKSKDRGKINTAADNFEKAIAKFKNEDLLENNELKENIVTYLGCLKDTDAARFKKCSTETLKQIARNSALSKPKDLQSARAYANGLRAEDIADTLWQEIVENDSFNPLSFNFFTVLAGTPKQNETIAQQLAAKVRKASPQALSGRTLGKLKELFLISHSDAVPEIYRRTLMGFLQDVTATSAHQRTLDQALLRRNYHFFLLNVLAEEKNRTRLQFLFDKISQEWDNFIQDKEGEFFKKFLSLYQKRKKELLFIEIFERLEKKIFGLLEQCILDGALHFDDEYFLDSLTESSLGIESYHQALFTKKKVSLPILRLYFKFFSKDLEPFYTYVQKALSDYDGMKNIIVALQALDTPRSLIALKRIYSFAATLQKIEILKAMQTMKATDTLFIVSVLKERNYSLRKEALTVIIHDSDSMQKALQFLFATSSPLGIRNKILEENVNIIQELNISKEARGYLCMMSKKRFFWNRLLRQKAQQALEAYDV